MLTGYSFGVTELAKGNVDEEGAHASTNIDEKPHNTHVQETTADANQDQDRVATRESAGEADRKEEGGEQKITGEWAHCFPRC